MTIQACLISNHSVYKVHLEKQEGHHGAVLGWHCVLEHKSHSVRTVYTYVDKERGSESWLSLLQRAHDLALTLSLAPSLPQDPLSLWK